MLTFWARNSFALMASTLINGRNTNSTSNLLAISKYGDFSLAGLGCETKIFFIISVLKNYSQMIHDDRQSTPK